VGRPDQNERRVSRMGCRVAAICNSAGRSSNAAAAWERYSVMK
jgi:hypothetical protein